jgi:hypothetical protein
VVAISGYLENQGRALVRLRLRGRGEWATATFEIDTGAQPSLVTSHAWSEFLMAETEARHMATLANGIEVPAMAILLAVAWLDGLQLVMGVCFAAPGGFARPGQRGPGVHSLLGRGLLRGCRLTIDYALRTVLIEPARGTPA